MSQKSIVNSPEEVSDRIAEMSKTYKGPFLVEEFIDGRELNVCLLGNGQDVQVLPISEILFGNYFKDKYKIIDFAAKWLEDSEEYKATLENRCPALLNLDLEEKVNLVAKRAYALVGCRDYARVDIRLSNDGQPYVLEVNANCAIGLGDGSVRSAKAAGFSYEQFLQEILYCSLTRAQK
jgi:D-alanine-D-alanine ligase